MVEVKDGSDTVASYEHNGLGWRIQADVNTDGDGTTDETRYVYYSQQWQRLEVRVDGLSSSDLGRQYVWGLRYINALVCRDRDTNGDGTTDERVFALDGPNFNVWASTDDTGSVQERFAYTPYAEQNVQDADFIADGDDASDNDLRVGHQGLCHDPETGLVYNRNRMRHPRLGRFTSRDPLGYVDGMRWNLYLYTQSNPVGRQDPFGHKTFPPGTMPPPAPDTSDFYSANPRRVCRIWFEQEKKNMDWLEKLPDCKCRVSQVPCSWWKEPEPSQYYHPGAATCFRKEASNGSGQQCCYDREGQLITEGAGAGTPEYVAPGWYNLWDTARHVDYDVRVYSACKRAGMLDWYREVRPPNNRNNCEQNRRP